MYEDKSQRFTINWKSVLIKMAILLVVLFLVLWIVSLVTRKDNKKSNISENLKIMQSAANEYFTGSKLPEKLNGKASITLKEMINSKLIVEFKDQNGKACELNDSFAEATKVSDEDYTIKVKLVCGKENDYVINTIKVKNELVDNNNEEEPITDEDNNNNTDNNDNVISDNSGNTTNTPSTNTSKPSTNKKPTTTSKPSTNTNTNTNSSSSNNNNNTTKPSTNTCNYGSNEYSTGLYTPAYLINSNCAVSKDDYYKATYASEVNKIGSDEYTKLRLEIAELAKNTGADLYLESPVYSAVYNKTNTGLVGYQIKYVVRQKDVYSTHILYAYYLKSDGTRKVITDTRSSVALNSNTSAFNNTTLSLNVKNKTLKVGEQFTIDANVYPTSRIVSYGSSNKSVATVSDNGLVVAKSVGTAIITAATGDVKASAVITVVEDEKASTTLSLNVSSKSLKVGETFTLKATTNSSKKVSFSSSSPLIASVNQNGLVTALREGVTTITASVDGTIKSAVITVTNNKVTKIEILDKTINLRIGESHKLNYAITPKEASYGKILYFRTNNKYVATINNEGVITGVGRGSAVITLEIDGVSASITINVN